MLKAALAFIPLLSGYIFCRNWRYTLYAVSRLDSQQLYFHAAIYGLVIGISGLLVAMILSGFSWFSPVAEQISSLLGTFLGSTQKPSDAVLAVGLVLSFALGPISAAVLNAAEDYLLDSSSDEAGARALRKAIAYDDFETILYRAATKTLPVSISMSDGKVYVGFVCRSLNPGEKREMLRILPIMSGYRDQTTHKLEFTTLYSQCYEELERSRSGCKTAGCPGAYESPVAHLDDEDFEIVIERSLIRTLNIFDIEAYVYFKKMDKEQLELPLGSN